MVSKRNLLFQQWNFTFERFALGWPPFLNNCPEPFSKTGHNRRAPNRPNQPTFLLTVQDFKLCKKDHTFHICLANAVHKRHVNTSLQLFFRVPIFLRDLQISLDTSKEAITRNFFGVSFGRFAILGSFAIPICTPHRLTLFLHPILANQLTIKGIHQHHLRPRSGRTPNKSWDTEKDRNDSHQNKIHILGVAPSQQQWQVKVYRDSLLKLVHNPGGHCYWEGAIPNTYLKSSKGENELRALIQIYLYPPGNKNISHLWKRFNSSWKIAFSQGISWFPGRYPTKQNMKFSALNEIFLFYLNPSTF